MIQQRLCVPCLNFEIYHRLFNHMTEKGVEQSVEDMNDTRKRLIHIHVCRGIGWKTIAKFFAYDRTLAAIFDMTETELKHIFSMRDTDATLFYYDLQQAKVENLQGVSVITLFDEAYPKLLRDIYDPPWVLYCRGDVSILKQANMLSVVGTRSPSRTGFAAMKKLLAPMIHEEWGIVSGLAQGIDSAAHRLALNSKTIAVLGSGFDHIYPESSRSLAVKIASEHLLISEYPPSRPAKPWQFPQRNRIISGLTLGTLVIEAREKSGSLITADQALEQGREVFAVPGSIFESRSYGTNRLIQQGAKLVLKAEDLLEEWSFQNTD